MELTKRRRVPMMPNAGMGKEIGERLRRELSIPDSCKWFEVRFEVGEVITVTCEFMPKEGQD